MNNPVKVHQIWVGSPVPARENAWIDTVKEWCNKRNIEYKLWSLEDLKQEYSDEPIWEFADTLPDTVRKWVLLADYFRIIVMNNGEFYCDTDFMCYHCPSINVKGNYALHLGEYWDGRKLCNGLFAWQENFKFGDILKNEARKQVANLNENWEKDLCACFGPAWTRDIFQKYNIPCMILPRNVASHVQWKNKAALVHQGAGSWI